MLEGVASSIGLQILINRIKIKLYHGFTNVFWKFPICYINTFHSRFIPEGAAEASQIFFYYSLQNYLAMRDTADVTGGKPIAVWSQSILGVSAINPLDAFYDIHRRKGEVLFFYFVPDTTRDTPICSYCWIQKGLLFFILFFIIIISAERRPLLDIGLPQSSPRRDDRSCAALIQRLPTTFTRSSAHHFIFIFLILNIMFKVP
jgi:hypothetical protein